MPTCWILAGPNGAGKTTFALKYLPNVGCTNFVNADLIAAGLSPLQPERETIAASRILLKEIKAYIAEGESFAFETTLSGRGYLKLINQLKSNDWRVELIYLALPDIEMSKSRVAERVLHGGHNIPIKDIERRYPKSLSNLLNLFSPIVDRCYCYMNESKQPILIFQQNGESRKVYNKDYYQLLLGRASL